jgi:hypothetical protein
MGISKMAEGGSGRMDIGQSSQENLTAWFSSPEKAIA